MKTFKKTLIIIFFIFVLLFCFIHLISYCSNAKADDYSFEYTTIEDYSPIVTKSIVDFNIGSNSPSAKYNQKKQIIQYQKNFRKFHLHQKYTYKPYSPTIYQKRQKYDPEKIDWDDPWFYKYEN